jgi:prevent-host-death family protein
MREIGAFEAKNTFGSLLDLVQAGEEVAITRHGRRVARIVRDTGESDYERAHRAAKRILERSERMTLGGLKIKDLINEGRA